MFGEVFICQFPFTSGTGSKIRPALVLFDLQQDAVICRVTSASRSGTLEWQPPLQDYLPGEKAGLLSGIASGRPASMRVIMHPSPKTWKI